MPSPKNPSLTLLIRRAEKKIAKLRASLEASVMVGPVVYAEAKSELAIAEQCLTDLRVERFRLALGERPDLGATVYRRAFTCR